MFLNHIFIFFCYFSDCFGKKYDNYTLFRGVPLNAKELFFFQNLSHLYDVCFWREPGSIHKPIDFSIGPDDVSAFLTDTENNDIHVDTMIEDIQKAFDQQSIKTYIRRNMDSYDWSNYFRLTDMYEWFQDLTKKYPREVTLINMGKSLEQRDIYAVQIVLKGSARRSKVLIEGGIHAREWISPAFVTYMMNEILRSSECEDMELKTIALTYEWFFVPVMNPDGYEYSHTQDRLWRKNRRGGYGVDLNRNFDVAFAGYGVSDNKNDEPYPGEKPFSEPESVAMADLVRRIKDNLEYYVSFHSYGQYFILPYSFSKEHLDNYDEMKVMGDTAATMIRRRYGTEYIVGTGFDTIGYMASGVSTCWAKKNFKIPYVGTFELRDRGQYGFALPSELILPTCRETMDGMISLLTPRNNTYTKLRKHYALNKQNRVVYDSFAIIVFAFISVDLSEFIANL